MTKEQTQVIYVVAAEVYKIAQDHGFHTDEKIGRVSIERLASFVANIHGEVSELWEAARKGTLHARCDKKHCHMSNLEEELADIVIRAFDNAHAYGLSLGEAMRRKSLYNESRPFMHGKLV